MILITGATGHLGGKVIETMLSRGVPASEIAAFVRNENKAARLIEQGISICTGSYDDKAALATAMQGVDWVLLVSSPDRGKILEQHQNVIDAAREAKVKCLGYTSHCLADRNTLVNQVLLTHFETEDYIKSSGLNYKIFRNILYMDSMAQFIIGGKQALEDGITLPAGNAGAAYALRSDEAEAIGNVLATGDCNSQVYNFTGSRLYSFFEVAEALSELSGKKVTYTPVEVSEFKQMALQQGLQEPMVDFVIAFVTDIKNGQESTVTTDLEEALGRKPIDLKTGLKLLLDL